MSTTSPQKPNGMPANDAVRVPQPLPSHDVEDQIHRRGSAGSARTHLDTRPIFDLLLSCFQIIVEYLRKRKPKAIDIDELDCRQLSQHVSEAVVSSPRMAEMSREDLPSRLKLLQELYAERPTKSVRLLKQLSQSTIDERVAAVIAQVTAQAEVAPFGYDEVLSQVEQAISGINYPDPDTTAFPRFRTIVESINMLKRQDVELIPGHLIERMLPTLKRSALEVFQKALDARCLLACNQHLRGGTERIQSTLTDARGSLALLRTAIGDIRHLLQQKREQSYSRHAISASANLLRLEGPSERELLAGLKSQLNAESTADLAVCLTEQLVDRLTQVAGQRYPLIPAAPGVTTLLARVAPVDVADTLERLVDELIGASHSVYASVRSFGVEPLTEELLRRSSPLCRLRSRDRSILGVETARKTVARLPAPLGAEDQQTYRDVRDVFESINVACLEAPAGERNITVVQTLIGFPIAIDSNQEALLEAYATSEVIAHLPHLFGIVPECNGGEPLDVLVELFRELRGDEADGRW